MRKGTDKLLRNLYQGEKGTPQIPFSINRPDVNFMSNWIGKTRTAIRRNNAVILEFNDSFLFAL